MSIIIANSINQNTKTSNQLAYTNNIAGKLEDYFCNIMSLKLKLSQIMLLDLQPSVEDNLEKIGENAFEILTEKIEDFFKSYKINIKPNLRNLFIKISLLATKFISYLPFLKEDLNLLTRDSSFNSYKIPLSLLREHIQKTISSNLDFLQKINQLDSQLAIIHEESINLQESLIDNSLFKEKIKELKNEINSIETEIDKYNQTMLRANSFEKNPSPLVLSASHEETEVDNNSLTYTNTTRELTPPSIAFSVTRYKDKLTVLANNSPSLKTIFLLSQFVQDVSLIFKKLNSIIFDMNQFLDDMLVINKKFESFINENKTNSKDINEALSSIENAKDYFLNLHDVSAGLLSKTTIELSHYLKKQRNLKLFFLLQEPEINIYDFEFEYI